MKSESTLMARFRISPTRLLLLAAVLHVTVTLTVFTVGRLQLVPAHFDANGTFAADGYVYRIEVEKLAGTLRNEGFRVWFYSPAQFHLKLYSLVAATVQRWAEVSIATVEPLNLIYYLLLLVLVFKLGREVFDKRAGLLAAAIVALWPSLLLHTTQILKDPVVLIAILTLILIIVRWLTTSYSLRRIIGASIAGALAVLVIVDVRLAMWDIVRAVAALGLVFLFVRQVRERQFLKANCVSAALLVVAILVIPQFRMIFQAKQEGNDLPAAESVMDKTLWERITERRKGFALRAGVPGRSGSDLDVDVRFESVADLVRYLPRAVAIGLFAPFPNMWFVAGTQVGTAGRCLSGVEMLLTYLIEALAVIGFWQKRRQLAVWLLLSTVILGATALGVIVLNIGSLYRLRYPFWILLVVLAAGGTTYLLGKQSRTARDSSSD